MPQISVIVPVYKVEQYLCRCVDSILAQTFSDYEIILVDDGSPDNCGAICDEYATKNERIHVIHQANGGLSAARNAGIDWAFANSDSQWLSFIDSDDWVHPSFLEYLFRALKEKKTDISICSLKRVSEKTAFETVEYPGSLVFKWAVFYAQQGALAVGSCNKLYAKQLFLKIRYPVNKLHEDDFLTHKILFQAQSVSFVELELYYYFINDSGITGSPFSPKRMDLFEALEDQIRFAKEHSEPDFFSNRVRIYGVYLSNYIQLIDESNLSLQEKKKLHLIIQKKMRWLLRGPAKQAGISFQDNKWYYEIAYPKAMWVYWTVKGVLHKLHG